MADVGSFFAQAAPVVAGSLALALYAHLLLRGRTGAVRLAGFGLGVVWAMALPWLAPADVPTARFFTALWSFLAVIRLADVAWGRYPAPQAATSVGRFLLVWVIGPDMRWPADDPEAQRFRAQGRWRIARGVAQVAGAFVLLAASTAWPEIHEGLWTQAAWALATTLFLLPGGLAVTTGLVMLAGLYVEETFDDPLLSRSPRDFWSRRWNRLFQAGAQRHIFRPLLRRRRPVVAILAVFVFSAAVHEYLVIAALGSTNGGMTAFFALHCVATLADWATRRWPRLPRPVAITAHTLWFWAGFPLFMVPILQALPIHEIRLW